MHTSQSIQLLTIYVLFFCPLHWNEMKMVVIVYVLGMPLIFPNDKNVKLMLNTNANWPKLFDFNDFKYKSQYISYFLWNSICFFSLFLLLIFLHRADVYRKFYDSRMHYSYSIRMRSNERHSLAGLFIWNIDCNLADRFRWCEVF